MVNSRKSLLSLTAALSVVAAACTGPARHRYAYTCADGHAFTVTYSDQGDLGDIAVLEDASGSLKLPRAPASSGQRYMNDATVFRSEAAQAMIMREGEIVHERCTT